MARRSDALVWLLFNCSLLFVLSLLLAQAVSCEKTTTLSIHSFRMSIDGASYERKGFAGNGPAWKIIDNVGCFVTSYKEPFDVVYVNELEEQTIIHAHGLTPPSLLDGAPYISSLPLDPGREQLVTYTLQPHNTGSNFLHSHYAFQLGEGIAAPFIVSGPLDQTYPLWKELAEAQESILFLQDVCPYIPYQVKRQQQRQSQCSQDTVYQFLKEKYENTTKPFPECPGVKKSTTHEVYYRHLIANGKTLNDPVKIKVEPGKFVRLRIINAAGMSTYNMKIPKELIGRTYIVAVDGQLTHPHPVESFWLSNAQRADLLIGIPEQQYIGTDTVFPILGITEGIEPSPQSGVILYTQDKYPDVPNPPLIAKEIVGYVDNHVELQLKAWSPLVKRSVDKVFDLKLTGDNGFDSINGRSYQMFPEAPYAPNPFALRVAQGWRVQINFLNNNGDGHPMHLHGHSFQVINIDGKALNGALRDTVVVPGGCRNVSVIFDANNPGLWPLHCHMEFHLAAGMVTTVDYYKKP